ncbi:recombinase RecA [Myxococcota bacterium]
MTEERADRNERADTRKDKADKEDRSDRTDSRDGRDGRKDKADKEDRSDRTSDRTEKNKQVARILQTIEKTHGRGAIMQLGDMEVISPMAVIPTGSLALDQALGTGGYPRGRIVEVFGPESGGKTTLTLHAIAQVQAAGGAAAFIDAEHAFDLRYARAIGVDVCKLLISQPDNGEQALEITEVLTRSGAIELVVIDSVAALVPRAEIEGDMGEAHMGLQARLMSQAARKLAGIAAKTGTTLLFINQLRHKIGVVFGNPETTPGGQALKFYASVRLDVRRSGKVTLGDQVVGNRTKVKVVKNKCAPPFAEAEFDIRWGHGIDGIADLVEVATSFGVIEKSGSHLLVGGKSIGQGRERAREALLGESVLREAVSRATLGAMASKSNGADAAA